MTWQALLNLKRVTTLIIFILLLAACNSTETTTPSPDSDQIESPTPELKITSTPTPFILPTPEPGTPLAALVNGQAITLEEYQEELERAQIASETGLVTFTEGDVLQNLIDEVLLVQGAAEKGFVMEEDLIQSRLDQLELDDPSNQDWLSMYGYTQESFEQAFRRTIAATWMRDQIIHSVPSTAEQVHARQILLYNFDEAENAYSQLQAGTDFATLASQYDPITSGELGWFPRGYLTVPELESIGVYCKEKYKDCVYGEIKKVFDLKKT